MQTEQMFRYAKPTIKDLVAVLPKSFTDRNLFDFTDSIAFSERNFATFDVLTKSGKVLNRERTIRPDYWFDGDRLVCREPGDYVLRPLGDLEPFERNVIPVGNQVILSVSGGFKVGIPFWPQVLTQPSDGLARVSNDGRNLAYVSRDFTGQVSFSYRVVNFYGQVSEPACVTVTVTP